MSVNYRTVFRKKDENGEEHTTKAFFERQFGEILDELEPISTHVESRSYEGREYEIYITTYDFADLSDLIKREKDKRKEYFDDMLEKQRNLYQVSSVELYEHIKQDIENDVEMMDFYDEKISFMEFIKNGVCFHFLYTENFYDTSDITFDVEVC